MQTKNAINKLLKAGAKDASTSNYRKRFILNNHAIEFFAQESGHICSLSVCGLHMEGDKDSMTDYFPQVFPMNMKHAIEMTQV